jgi:hypothetical protein
MGKTFNKKIKEQLKDLQNELANAKAKRSEILRDPITVSYECEQDTTQKGLNDVAVTSTEYEYILKLHEETPEIQSGKKRKISYIRDVYDSTKDDLKVLEELNLNGEDLNWETLSLEIKAKLLENLEQKVGEELGYYNEGTYYTDDEPDSIVPFENVEKSLSSAIEHIQGTLELLDNSQLILPYDESDEAGYIIDTNGKFTKLDYFYESSDNCSTIFNKDGERLELDCYELDGQKSVELRKESIENLSLVNMNCKFYDRFFEIGTDNINKLLTTSPEGIQDMLASISSSKQLAQEKSNIEKELADKESGGFISKMLKKKEIEKLKENLTQVNFKVNNIESKVSGFPCTDEQYLGEMKKFADEVHKKTQEKRSEQEAERREARKAERPNNRNQSFGKGE